MTTRPVDVGFLHMGSLSAEQRAALEWCRGTAADVGTVRLSDDPPDREGRNRDGGRDRDGDPDRNGDPDRTPGFSGYDVLWWHRDEPLWDLERLCGWRDAVDAYLREGGGLLLSLRALSAVSSLGIDRVPPDATGRDDGRGEVGPLWKAVRADHPAVAGFDGLRVATRGAGAPRPYARYEAVLPERGAVLAGTVRDGEDRPGEMAFLSWRRGSGRVVGAGAAVGFAEATDEACTANRERLVGDLLAHLGGDPATASDIGDGGGRAERAAELRALRASLADGRHRPRYHLTPPANWLNDPNGLIRWNGRYHVFYQYNPAGPFHNTIHWGHAASDDLVTWRDEPIALSPSPDGPDRDGCWSGCAVDDDGTPTVVYTGGRGRTQLPCLATAADPALRTWTKAADNPVIASTPDDLDVLATEHWAAEFRDHSVWRDGETWYQLVGSGIEGVGGAALLYESADLREWTYVGPFLVGDWEGAGPVWECPELLDFGDRQVLHVSNYDHVEYFVGELDAGRGRFRFERSGLLDYGDFYAPQSLRDPSGRILTWGWIYETRSDSAQWDAGWSGLLSLPRELDLDADGRLRQRPAAEVADRREAHLLGVATRLQPDESRPLDVRGDALELHADVGLYGADAFALHLRESAEERTVLRYTGEEIVIDRTDASLDPDPATDPHRMPVESDGPLDLRVFVDRSVIEVFANERRCLTCRVYPTREDSDGLSLHAEGGHVRLDSFNVWRMGSVWPTDDPDGA